MESKFDIVLGIDMETDVGSFTDMYEGIQHGTYRLLEIMEKNGAKATYFWTGHAATNNRSVVKSVVDAGHEIGCHSLVHETLGDALFPLPNNWPVCDFEVEGRIREATRQVTAASGVKPSSFRCPRLWGSTKVVQVLESLGFKADASLPLYFYRNNIKPYHPDVPMGPISDLKETVRNRMLLDLVLESYNKPAEVVQSGLSNLTDARADTYNFNEFQIIIRAQGISAEKLKLHHDLNGDDEILIAIGPLRLELDELDELEDFLDAPDLVKEDIQEVTVVVLPDAPDEILNGVKTILRKKQLLNVQYLNRNTTGFLDLPSTMKTEEPNWIGVEIINLSESEQYLVQTFSGGDVTDSDIAKNLKSAVKDLFKGKRKAFAIPYSEDNLNKVKEIIAKYPDKKVNWMY